MLVPHPRLQRSRSRKTLRRIAPAGVCAAAVTVLAATSALHPAAASPQGGTVTSGSATISTSGGQTVINTTTQQTIIQFDAFNIGPNDSVTFNQPNADSAVLNQIHGSGASFIDGALLSNGQVYIVNPAGVTFGRNAVVNVGRLVAAASVVNPDDFLNGIDRFDNSGSGNVLNNSDAILGDNGVVFVGQVVRNQGTVRSNGGTIAMVAGRDVLLTEGPEGQIFARIVGFNDPETRGPEFSNVANTGLIDNPTGNVLIGAGDLFGISVLRQGQINAQAVTFDTGDAPLLLSEPSSLFSTVSSDAMITINTARLEYFGDAAPNDRIWLNAPQGFVNLAPDADPNVGPASLNGEPFPGQPAEPVIPPVDPNPLGLTSTFIDRYAGQLPISPTALGGFDRVTPDAAQRQALAELFGLETTGFEDRPLADALAAANVVNDLSADPTLNVVSSERLAYRSAENALNSYQEVFGAADTDGGLAGAGPQDDVLPTELDQTQQVRARLQESADRYMADQEVTEIDPDAFVAWLEESDPDTLDALSGLDDLVNTTMPDLGLGATELNNFKEWTYGKIAPRGVSLRTLDELVAASAQRI